MDLKFLGWIVKVLAISVLSLQSSLGFARTTIETDAVCRDPFGAFEVASRLAKGEPVPRGIFLMNCERIPLTAFEIDSDHPQLMAAAESIYGIFKVTHGKKVKHALVKIR